MQKPHPRGHPKLSEDLGGRMRPVVGAHLSCPAPDGRGGGHVGAAAAPLHPSRQGHPFSFPYIYHFLMRFQSPSSAVHRCSLFPKFFLHRPLCRSCACPGCSSSGERLLTKCSFAFRSGKENYKSSTRRLQPYNPQRGKSRTGKRMPSSRSAMRRLAGDKTMVI